MQYVKSQLASTNLITFPRTNMTNLYLSSDRFSKVFPFKLRPIFLSHMDWTGLGRKKIQSSPVHVSGNRSCNL